MAGDLFGLSISAGMISKLERHWAAALEAPYNELLAAVHTAGVIHADGTSWRQERRKTWLWVAATTLMTVFSIARNRNAKVARAVWSAPQKLVHLKWESLARLCPGGAHEEATDCRPGGAIAP
jgi:Transposase IS66 family